MKLASIEHYRISALKLVALGGSISVVFALTFYLLLGRSLGAATPAYVLVAAVLVFYLVLSTPRRILAAETSEEAKESVQLSLAATAAMKVTGSRSRTVMLLRARSNGLAAALCSAKRGTLLGFGVEESTRRSAEKLGSYSAASALIGAATLKLRTPSNSGEEAQGLASSEQLGREVRVPVFMTLCFFAPTMILLYSVFAQAYGAVATVQLTVFEVVIIDLGYYLCSAEHRTK